MGTSSPQIQPDALAYVERVRHATRWFTERGSEDVQGALHALRGTAHFDVEAPVAGRREVQLVKAGVKRLSSWYLHYLSAQLDAFGANLLRLGDSLSAKAERLEHTSYELSARIGALEERVRYLEASSRPAGPPPPNGAPPSAQGPARPPADQGAPARSPAPAPAPPGTVGATPRSRARRTSAVKP